MFFLAPLTVVLLTSIKPLAEVHGGTLLSLPQEPTFAPWLHAWFDACTGIDCSGIRVGFWNSVRIAAASVFVSVMSAALCGYALSRWRTNISNVMFSMLVLCSFIPYQMILYPMVRVHSVLGTYGTLAGIVLVHLAFSLPMLTLIFRNFYISLPEELVKAARVDGAGFFRIFFSIMLPLSPGMLAVALILNFTHVWNDYLLSLTFAGRANQPMTVALNNLVNASESVKQYNVDMAATIIATLPTLLIYIFAGRHFVRGITSGAVKG
ncbi:MAG: carbohydrate ABC transporter permease [Luteimonas sp.]